MLFDFVAVYLCFCVRGVSPHQNLHKLKTMAIPEPVI